MATEECRVESVELMLAIACLLNPCTLKYLREVFHRIYWIDDSWAYDDALQAITVEKRLGEESVDGLTMSSRAKELGDAVLQQYTSLKEKILQSS